MKVSSDLQGNDGEDVISTLRNGSAAEHAVALMHEKGYTHRRRSRHRITPGTVKFAAFHVLSLEGSKGLTILEVADKIQVHVFCQVVKFFPSLTCPSEYSFAVPLLSEIWFKGSHNKQDTRGIYCCSIVQRYKTF